MLANSKLGTPAIPLLVVLSVPQPVAHHFLLTAIGILTHLLHWDTQHPGGICTADVRICLRISSSESPILELRPSYLFQTAGNLIPDVFHQNVNEEVVGRCRYVALG